MISEEKARAQLEFQKSVESCLDALMSALRYQMQYGMKENTLACEASIQHLKRAKQAFRQGMNYGRVGRKDRSNKKENK